MMTYIVIFLLSIGGIAIIALRNRQEIHEFRFALFVEDTQKRAVAFWYSHAHGQMLTLIEKYLRLARIQVLKFEHTLFRAAHGVRDINERTPDALLRTSVKEVGVP